MLLNKERRRSLQAVLVARPAHWSQAASPPAEAPPSASGTARQTANGSRQVPNEAATPRTVEQQPARGRRVEGRSEMTPQERAVVAQSFRARYALSEHRLLANLRRRHRVELLEELARLTKVAKALEEQINATERRVQIVERLAMRFERVSKLLQAASGAEPAPASTLPASVARSPDAGAE